MKKFLFTAVVILSLTCCSKNGIKTGWTEEEVKLYDGFEQVVNTEYKFHDSLGNVLVFKDDDFFFTIYPAIPLHANESGRILAYVFFYENRTHLKSSNIYMGWQNIDGSFTFSDNGIINEYLKTDGTRKHQSITVVLKNNELDRGYIIPYIPEDYKRRR